MQDAGSNVNSGLIKLSSGIAGLSSLFEGLRIEFTAPFTLNAQQIKALKRYEVIEIMLDSGSTGEIPVLRGAYTEDELYADGYKDNRPSFIAGKKYLLVFNGVAWLEEDSARSGSGLDFYNNTYTPAGYIDLAYNYNGIDASKFRFKASQDARLPYEGVVNLFEFGNSNLAMVPHHHHSEQLPKDSMQVKNGSKAFVSNNDMKTQDTGGVEGLDATKVILGDDNMPSNIVCRFLMKM